MCPPLSIFPLKTHHTQVQCCAEQSPPVASQTCLYKPAIPGTGRHRQCLPCGRPRFKSLVLINQKPARAGGSLWVQGQTGLHREFYESPGYIERPCLKKKKKRKKKTSILRSSGLNEMNLQNVGHRLTILLTLTIKHLLFSLPLKQGFIMFSMVMWLFIYMILETYFNFLFLQQILKEHLFSKTIPQKCTSCHFRKQTCSFTMNVCPQKDSYIYLHAHNMHSKVASSGSNGH